ncbi:MAG TPA: hypothetical protein ENJ56_07855 [Anaerolineae bacterium]|nr:hypothetical protein [Anaerolineae bacterium]
MTSSYTDPEQGKSEREFGNSPYPSGSGFDPEHDLRVADAQYLMLPQGRPPRQDDCLLHGALPDAEDVNVVVSQQALKQIVAHCHSNTRVELGGVLLGRPYHNNRQIFVEVEVAIPAITTDNGPVHFTFTADVWAQIHVDCSQYPDLEIVGWFHTHPDLGVFYSADDEVVHAAAFTQPYHVGLVVDPLRNQGSFFAWRDGVVQPIPGFYELIPAEAGNEHEVPRAIVDWEIVIDKSWFMPTRSENPAPGLVYQDGDLAIHPMLPLVVSTLALLLASIALYVALK